MALTDAQKAQIRTFLGYPNLYRYKNTRLEGAFSALDAAAESILIAEIAAVQTEDARLTEFMDRAGVKKVDEIEFFASSKDASDSIDRCRMKGRVHINRISVLLGVPINTDYFSTKGYPGDSFSAGGMGPENGYSAAIETKLA